MTNEQYERWKDFAFRMARTCYRTSRRPSVDWILERIEQFFDWLNPNDIPIIRNWDHSGEYPEGNPHYGREYHSSWCGCEGYRHSHHNKPNPDCGECHGRGLHHALFRGPLVCDSVTELLDDDGPYVDCDDDDGTRQEAADEQWDQQWGDQVRCCIRAGLDMACEPSMGVVGFTAGDIRQMWPDGVPDWVFPPGEKLVHAFTDPPVETGMFAELPDAAGVLL